MYYFTVTYEFSHDGSQWDSTYSNIVETKTAEDDTRKALIKSIITKDLQEYLDLDVPGGRFEIGDTTATVYNASGNVVCRVRNMDTQSQFPPEPTLKLCYGDACKYGLTDLNNVAEQNLRKILKEGIPFNTGWCGCQKEIRSFKIESDGMRKLRVSAAEEIDDVPDLIYDADMDETLTEEDVEYIEEMLDNDMEFRTETTSEKELPANASYEDIMKALEELEEGNRAYLNGMFKQVIALVDYVKSQNIV